VTGRTPEALWRTYIQLTDAEAAFRVQKSGLSLRPVWHQKAERVKAHVLWKTLETWQGRARFGVQPAHDPRSTPRDPERGGGAPSFWQRFAREPLNERQIGVLNRLLDGIEGRLTTSKWAKLATCSQDTAYRDILDLVDRGALRKDFAGGRSTSYSIAWHDRDPG